MELKSEREKRIRNLRNYLKKLGVVEARLKFNDGEIIDYNQVSWDTQKVLMDGLLGRKKWNTRKRS